MKTLSGLVFLLMMTGLAAADKLKVATLHPLLADLAKRVGGEKVQVVDLMGPDGDPHKFEPAAKDLREVRGAKLFFVSGKGLEPYLPKLRSTVGTNLVVEVGKTLPTLKADVLCDHGGHLHVHKGMDPHWWHSIDCWRRAARVMAKELARVDPGNKSHYDSRAKKVRAELATLGAWVKKELQKVPKEQRVLATAHAAFGYFCHEQGWRMLPVQGLNREQVASARFVNEVAKTLQEEKVRAIFPEKRSNPKMLKTLAESVGVKMGDALIADGGGSIDAMFKHNVTALVKSLGSAKSEKTGSKLKRRSGIRRR